MTGNSAAVDLAEGEKWAMHAAYTLKSACRLNLQRIPRELEYTCDYFLDRKDRKGYKKFEFKRDPSLGVTGNAMMELWENWDEGKEGWAHRYQVLDYMSFIAKHEELELWTYSWRPMKAYFWARQNASPYHIVRGVKNNPQCWIALIPDKEFAPFLIRKDDLEFVPNEPQQLDS